jgi:hypothetical protein
MTYEGLHSMRKSPRRVRKLLYVAILMAMFPPWSVRERRRPSEQFGPPNAGGYSFIACPPNDRERFGGRGEFTSKTAQIDFTRFFIQYLGLGLLIIVMHLRGAEKQRATHGGETKEGFFQRQCPTFAKILGMSKARAHSGTETPGIDTTPGGSG